MASVEIPAVFIDWITASEFHPGGGLPIITGGLCVWYDERGNARHERASPASCAGSFESAVRLGCDGGRVYISGNVGRFSRQDNLFNHGWPGTVEAANRVLLQNGLPAFTFARGVSENGERLGGRLSRLDITSNFCTGSDGQARAVIRWLSGQAVARVKRGQMGDESIWWANTRHMFKAYRKGEEMLKHGGPVDEAGLLEWVRRVAWCKDNGVVRVEVELKRRLLEELGLQQFGDVTDQALAEVFADQTSVLRRVDRSDEPDILAAIPTRSRGYASAWLKGQDLRAIMTHGTLYRHAKVLRGYGIDILQPRNVCGFPIKVRVVDLVPAAVPDWYSLKVA